jgi:hypothetical protein
MITFLVTIGFFYFLALGVSCAIYYWRGIGYEKAPVFWILYLGGVLALLVQVFPNEVWALFPPHTFGFVIGADIFLVFAAIAARLELVGRHPTYELFLKNRIEFARFQNDYLLVKSIEVFLQQVLFGVLAIGIGAWVGDPYLGALATGLVIGAAHLPTFLFVRPSMAFGMVAFATVIGLSVGASVLILGMGIAVSLPLHWLIYLGAVPFLWRMCEAGTCPFA